MAKPTQGDVQERLRQAWTRFEQRASAEQVAGVREVLRRHSEALTGAAEAFAAKPSEFALVRSLLEDTLEQDMQRLLPRYYTDVTRLEHLEAELGIAPAVLADGEILGIGKYEVLDVGWAEAFITWLDHYFDDKRPFPAPATWVSMPERATLAIFGDWGGGVWDGNAVAGRIASAIAALGVDYCIHLGDVYYAGEPAQETDYLLGFWPGGRQGNCTLNSNHEMYPLGKGYFDTALADPRFALQDGKSHFALENGQWIVVGLDSAFAADKEDLYLIGAINAEQEAFLREVGGKGKPVIVLSHHNPADLDGGGRNALWQQVAEPLQGNLRYWYWGHIHGGAVYRERDGVACRLVGHGVIPWGNARTLRESDQVAWYEHATPEPASGVRVQNGFVLVTLDGSELREEFYGEDGRPHWPKG